MAKLSWDELADTAGGLSRGVGRLLRGLFGSSNERLLQGLLPLVNEVNTKESWAKEMDQAQMLAQTKAWKQALQKGEITIDSILPQAFAMVREAGQRALGMRHFDVQILGGIVLHQGKIAEMSTGEGKTLVATLPAYLNALEGKGTFIVTVNDYLARRDRDWMAPVYEYLGLSVGAIQSPMSPMERQPEYASDITYGTNNEFGFDYLRDNMKVRVEDQVQKFLHYAIIDEVDSILVDEARTPLIISGPAQESNEKYVEADRVARRLAPGRHFEIKEKEKIAPLSEEGVEEAEKLAGVDTFYSGKNMDWPHLIETSLRAHHLYKLDRDYVIKDGEIIIVDEFTGRLMPGRRWSDGLHQAIEAKEGIRPREENQTLATITFQNYFRLFDKIAGMTGTAMTEAAEFAKIYNLDVVSIPTNRPNIRIDEHDVVYRTQKEKLRSITEEIVSAHTTGQPILVGTVSIESSERLSAWLKDPTPMREWLALQCDWARQEFEKQKEQFDPNLQKELREILNRPAAMDAQKMHNLVERVRQTSSKGDLMVILERLLRTAQTVQHIAEGVGHSVLNAKYHEKEAEIIAQAGRVGQITIATNMAGRGTDILLGGNPDALLKKRMEQEGAQANDSRIAAWREEFQALFKDEHQKVLELGGLFVLGTERHEARRIDNQLRGRCARQGDPGRSKFFLSLEDDLMRIFYREGVVRLMERLGMTEGQDITSGMVTRVIERAQKKVEARNFEARRNLLEYDEVMDKQRKFIYEQRQEVLESVQLKEKVLSMIDEVIPQGIALARTEKNFLDEKELRQWVRHKFGFDLPAEVRFSEKDEELEKFIFSAIEKRYQENEQRETPENMRKIERFLLLNAIDTKWKDHLYAMDALREGIGLRGYAQVDPKNEYKREGFQRFQELLSSIADEVTNYVLKVHIETDDEKRLGSSYRGQSASHPAARSLLGGTSTAQRPRVPVDKAFDMYNRHRQQQDQAASANLSKDVQGPARSSKPEVGRNDPCPCGSGKKYKKCHGTVA